VNSSARTTRALERDPHRRITKKVGTSLALLLGLVVAMIGFAPSAFAHHANIKVNSAVCDLSGGYLVSVTSTSWETTASGERVLNSNIQIDYRTTGAPSFTDGVASGSYVQTNPAGGTPSFTTTFVVPVGQGPSIEVRARPVGVWTSATNSTTLAASAGDARSVSYTIAAGDCAPHPSVTNVAKCATQDGVEGVNVTVTNTGKSAGDLAVATTVGGIAGPTLQFTAVAANGGTQTKFLPVPEDSTFSVNGGATQTNDCKQPNVGFTSVVECATNEQGVQGVNVKVTNAGTQAGDINVPVVVGGVPSSLVFTNVAPNGGTQTKFLAVGEDVTYSVNGGGTQTNDCKQPNVSFSYVTECITVDGVQGINVTVTNAGTQAGGLTVPTVVGGVPGSLSFTNVTPNGGTQTKFLAVGEDVSYSVNGGQSDVNDCAQPNVTLTSVVECASDDGVLGVNVKVTNSGTQAGDISVSTVVGGVPGSLSFTNVAPNGGMQTKFLAVGEDVAFTVGDTPGVNDCAQPDVNLTSVVECATNDGVLGVNVKVTNDGTQGGDLTLPTTVGGLAGPDLVFTNVAPKGTQTQFLAVPEDSTFSVDGGVAATNDCAQPNVALTSVEECAAQDGALGVIVTVTNGGDQAGDLTIPTTVGGAAGPDLVFTDVAPNGGTQAKFLPVGEDVSYSIDGGTAVANDCVQSNVTLTSVAACATVDGVRGVNVTVTNNGGQAGSLTVPTTVGGVAGPDLVFTDVAPSGGTQTRFLSFGEDVTYSVGDRALAVNDCQGPPPVDVCPNIPGDQPKGTNCNPPVDVCPDIPGDQPTGTDCNPRVDVCPAIPGDQPTGTDCNPPVDVCPTIPGDQPTGTDCNPPVDLCPTVEGVQLTMEACTAVLPNVVTPTPTPTPTPAPIQVAGVQLPRTGAESQSLGLVGAGLLLLGAGLLLARRREVAELS
jgi:LPXTG-motif cell wall-anchored protein